MVIELPDSQGEALAAAAATCGLSLAQYLGRLAEDRVPAPVGASANEPSRRISQVIADIMADVPPAELATLPSDGASEHDHYIYGWPRKYTTQNRLRKRTGSRSS